MCSVGVKGEKADENGPEFAQKLANLLGCRVKVYLEPVSPYGLRPTMDKEGKKFIPENFAQWAANFSIILSISVTNNCYSTLSQKDRLLLSSGTSRLVLI